MLRRACRLAVTIFVLTSPASLAQSNSYGAGGVAGSSSGSPGLPDTEAEYIGMVQRAVKKGKTSVEYINALIALAMHYNRQNRFQDASKTLNQALSIVDGGALKPTPANERKPEKIVEQQHGDGTVSAEVVRTPMPYEETVQGLLQQLVTAEIGSNQLASAEKHLKRLINLKAGNEVADKVSLMSAYMQYSELLRKLHRNQ